MPEDRNQFGCVTFDGCVEIAVTERVEGVRKYAQHSNTLSVQLTRKEVEALVAKLAVWLANDSS